MGWGRSTVGHAEWSEVRRSEAKRLQQGWGTGSKRDPHAGASGCICTQRSPPHVCHLMRGWLRSRQSARGRVPMSSSLLASKEMATITTDASGAWPRPNAGCRSESASSATAILRNAAIHASCCAERSRERPAGGQRTTTRRGKEGGERREIQRESGRERETMRGRKREKERRETN
jgi:hypothetical protein